MNRNHRYLTLFIIALIAFTGSVPPHVSADVATQSQPNHYTLRVKTTGVMANDIIYDPLRNKIYASNASGSIIPIDATSGAAETPVAVGSGANRLALSDNGQYLYIGLDDAKVVSRLDLATLVSDTQFPLGASMECGPYMAGDMVVLKDIPTSVAVAKRTSCSSLPYAGVTVYDNGAARPVSTYEFSEIELLEPSGFAATLYGRGHISNTFRVMTISSDGIRITSEENFYKSLGYIAYADGLVYTGEGYIIDPDTLTIAHTYLAPTDPYSPFGHVIPDVKSGKIYFFESDTDANSLTLSVFDLDTATLEAAIVAREIHGYPKSFIQAGPNKFAVRMSTGPVYLLDLIPTYAIYLPAVEGAERPCLCKGIYGSVSISGRPAPGVTLDLLFDDGSSTSTVNWQKVKNTTTDVNGNFAFSGVPSLQYGQKYTVRYENSKNPALLSAWNTRSLRYYTAGTNVNIGDFDITNIELSYPAPGATVTLPYAFSWLPRRSAPGDDYQFTLDDPLNMSSFFYSPDLGYAMDYYLESLPSGFTSGIPYGWYIVVHNKDEYGLYDGHGLSFYMYEVTFGSSGYTIQPSAMPQRVKLAELERDLLDLASARQAQPNNAGDQQDQ